VDQGMAWKPAHRRWLGAVETSLLRGASLPGFGQAGAPKADPPSLFARSLSELMNVPILNQARKEEVLLRIPSAVTVLSEQELADFDVCVFTDFAVKVATLPSRTVVLQFTQRW